MDRHELKARIDAQDAEWMRNLATMKAKADVASGEAKVRYQDEVAKLQEQLNDLRIQGARLWDTADDKWDTAAEDLQARWGEWELRAKSALNDLMQKV